MASGTGERCDLGGSTRSNAGDLQKLGLLGRKDVQKGPESCEESASSHGRDTWCSRQCLLGRREPLAAARALSIDGSVTCRCFITAREDAQNPVRRIAGVLAPADGYSEIGNRHNQSPHRFRGKTPVIQRQAFDQEVRPTGRMAKLPDLRPEAPFYNRLMEIWNALAFDQGDVIETVVTRGEPALVHVRPESDQFKSDPRWSLVNIHGHAHDPMLTRQLCRHARQTETKPPTSDFAGS